MVDETTELRKLAPSHVSALVDILEYAESWKNLMKIIPRQLDAHDFERKPSPGNLPKYGSDHFRKIVWASENMRRPCTEILFDEWGTSGRVRPALGHLFYLLKEAELLRAADYVADLLNVNIPERPKRGPAAKVVLFSEELHQVEPQLGPSLERNLDNMPYPESSDIANVTNNAIDVNLNRSDDGLTNGNGYCDLPKIIILSDSNNENVAITSDFMKFSGNGNSGGEAPIGRSVTVGELPAISALMPNSEDLSGQIIPQISLLLRSDSAAENTNNPEVTPTSTLSAASDNGTTPNFSALMTSTTEQTTIASGTESQFLPAVLNSSSLIVTATTKTSNASNSRNCATPLPNLNTLLPHFTYVALENATKFFDETPHKNSLEMADSLDENNGRFLGKGAFGSVYLALGLVDRPVAVKKLHLDEKLLNMNDNITKQFRLEVELLSKYSHDHLLSLVGYSCDGPTYCLMYEYLSGGNLQDRLQKTKEKLDWRQRITIAHGTAGAVTYLHTAFQTPLIHRDIKTANILLDCSNNPKLGDFGIVKLSPNPNTTATTTIVGTSAYMATEVLRSGDFSEKSDSFSFGVVLLELLTALPPSSDDFEEQYLFLHVQEECENNTITKLLDIKAGTWMESGTDFADCLFKVAMKCLEDKKKRPKMAEVLEMLNAFVKDV